MLWCILTSIHFRSDITGPKGERMTSRQLEYTEAELLTNHDVAEPLIAGGVRCHGGFTADGSYVSPRTKHRVPGVQAWQEQHRATFGTEVLHAPLELWPENFPNVDQARFLIRSGVNEPLIATLTRIGTVEGYGANIRLLQPGNLQTRFVEDIKGTAIDHLGRGLFEAHGRDEAGWEQEAGHKDMWFAARDVAFDGQTADVDIDAMLARMGFGQPGSGSAFSPDRLLPDDIDVNLEIIANFMVRVLFIEISAFHTFRWAEAWLSDRDLVAGDGEAADLVSYIRADETPHVDYLRTALTEMRDRTWIGASGKRYPGTEMIAALWDAGLEQSLGAGREAGRKAIRGEVEHWVLSKPGGKDLLAEFDSLATADRAA